MSNVDKKARKSFCLQSRMYRIKQNRSGKINFICDSNIDKHNEKFRINNKDIFEFYPYKPYWFYRLKFNLSKTKEKNKQTISILKKLISSWWIKGVIMAITLYAIKVIFEIDL